MPAPGLIRHVPNVLTVLRLGIAAAFPFIPREWRLAAVVIGGASDGLDGLIARRYGAHTQLGAVLDAVADKVFTLAVLVTLTFDGPLRWWQVVLLLSRDLAVAVLAALALARGEWAGWRRVRPRWPGKVATALVIVTMIVALAAPEFTAWIVLPAIAVSLWAAADYLAAEVRAGRTPAP